MERYDAIIIGGGPAGLALGSELSRKHKILIIEKGNIGKTTKAWTTEKKIVEKCGLKKFVSASFKKCYIKVYDSDKHFVKDDFVSMDEGKLLSHFVSMIKKNKSEIVDKCEFIGARVGHDFALVGTNKKSYLCKLLIDCSGYDSKLAEHFKIYKRKFYFPVYGGIYDCGLGKSDISLFETKDRKYPLNLFEYFPASKKKIIFYTFQYLSYRKDPLKLRKMHKLNMKACDINDKIKKRRKETYGIISMGNMKKHAVDNIFFFGDSSLIAPPFAGFGFSAILIHYRKFAEHLSKRINQGKLSEKDLDYKFSEKEMINRNFQDIIGAIMLRAKPKQIEMLMNVLKDVPNNILSNFIFLRLTIKQYEVLIKKILEHFGLKGLAKILSKKEYMFVAEEAAKIIEEVVVEEAEKLFHKHHKSI